MKTQYQNIVELAQAVEEARVNKRDLIADTRQLTMVPSGTLQVNGEGEFPVNDYAHSQVAARLGIPQKYYERMRTSEPELMAHNVNTWFQKTPERRMVRVLKGNVRAFLSDSYQRVENEEVLGTLLPVLKEFGSDLKIQSLALTESRMYLKATVSTVTAEIKVGDIVEAGVEIRNGEIGNSRFEVWPFANRLRCLNGMRFDVGGFKKTHLGARAEVTEDVYEMLSDETLRADDRAFMLKARDVVKATLSDDTFQKLVAKMRGATEDRIEGDPIKAVEVLSNKLGFDATEQAAVLRHLIEGADLSRWGVSNALTRTAQDLVSYDRSDEFEGFGGKLIEASASEWAELSKAA